MDLINLDLRLLFRKNKNDPIAYLSSAGLTPESNWINLYLLRNIFYY